MDGDEMEVLRECVGMEGKLDGMDGNEMKSLCTGRDESNLCPRWV